MGLRLRKNGHTVNFVDLVRHPLNKEDIEKQIKDNNPDLIAFSGIITTYYQLEELNLVETGGARITLFNYRFDTVYLTHLSP